MLRFAYYVQMTPRPSPRPDLTQARIDREAGAMIERLRRARGLSRPALGAACGVSGQQIEKYENGINRMSFGRAAVIAEALGAEVTALFPPLCVPAALPGPQTARRRLAGAQLARLALRIDEAALDHLVGVAKALAGAEPPR